MSKKAGIFFVLTNLLAFNAFAQNLVLNGGFETAAECPLTGRFDFFSSGPCKFWTCPPNGTPDYYTYSCGSPGSSTTTNDSKPQEGQAFAGLYDYGNFGTMFNREYVEGTLSQTLIKGHTYCVRFYVKPMLSDRFSISAAIESVGLLFSDKLITTTDADLLLRAKPQIRNQNGVIDDTSKWVEISGCYTATGNENFLLIGNFDTDANSNFKLIKNSQPQQSLILGYLLVDNVSVTDISSAALLNMDQISICAGDSALIGVNKQKFDNILWEDGDTSVQKYFKESGEYIVKASYQKNCIVADTITITETNCKNCHFWFPGAFTPDDNTRNEEFHLESDCAVKLQRMRIYNRWGETMLDATGKKTQWDGTYLGIRAPAGVYVYMCEILYEYNSQIKREVVQGTVTLLR